MGIPPCTILSCTQRSHPLPWVLREVPLKIFWLIQVGWKFLPGPQSIGDISFPPSQCFLAGQYAKEGSAHFGLSGRADTRCGSVPGGTLTPTSSPLPEPS